LATAPHKFILMPARNWAIYWESYFEQNCWTFVRNTLRLKYHCINFVY
jgi:hypothetical protein